VRGVHREDVGIRRNGIKLRGDDATLKPPARWDSPCSKASGPTTICVLGGVNLETFEVTGPRVSDVSVSGFKIVGLRDKDNLGIDVTFGRNTTVVGNRVIDMLGLGIGVAGSVNTTVAKNHLIGSPSPETDNDAIVVEFSSRTKVVKNVVRSYPEGQFAIESIGGSRDTTIAGNDLVGNWVGVLVDGAPATKILSNDITDSTLVGTLIVDSTGTKIVSNDIHRSGDTGIAMFGPEGANNDAKVVGNNISGGPAGIYVANAHRGSFAANTIHDNCAGMFFEADGSKEPVSGFEVKANTVKDNTRSCRAGQFERNVSGIGIALLGTTDMEVTANHLSGNVPSGPTAVSGGVVVSTDPAFGGSAKLRNNSVTGNHFGRNKPDIFWDESGTGNRFLGNLCDTSVPSRLCN
jgi:nitrous oxidase accessory protein NosD